MRADVFLFTNALAKSRTHAAELIKSGVIFDGKKIEKPSFDIPENADISRISILSPSKYVSRGGLKLEAALDAFGIDVASLTALDIGASTGGFTDCLLKRGAAKVYATDVGHGQLDKALASDPRVVNIEGVNARNMTERDIGASGFPLAVSDISFISQALIYGALCPLLSEDGIFISLIKPQFECGKENLSSGGICRDKKVHIKVIEALFSLAPSFGLFPEKLIRSPIEGGDGNREYLALFCKNANTKAPDASFIEKIVMGDTI